MENSGHPLNYREPQVLFKSDYYLRLRGVLHHFFVFMNEYCLVYYDDYYYYLVVMNII